MELPPNYTHSPSTTRACQYCALRRDVDLRICCVKYEVLTYLDALCDSFEPIGPFRGDPPTTPQEMKKLKGPWMKYVALAQAMKREDSQAAGDRRLDF